MDRREIGIYVHIPFCVRKCAYCDFLSFPASEEKKRLYFRALRTEIASFGPAAGYEAVSVYFGGGTPSFAAADEITGTLEVIRRTFPVREDAEITIECNPGAMEEEKLGVWRHAGFNRLSIGLQSADDALLQTMGRIHTREEFLREYRAARRAGFDNINVDLMYGIPGQTLSSWEETLDLVTALKPEHISAYSLIIEEGTPFWERYHEDDETRRRGDKPLFLPDEDTQGRMEDLLRASLQRIGIHRYEISNYARPGRESRHNTGYWRRREYAGFGLGASGQLERTRYRNTQDLEEYLKTPGLRQEELLLSREDEMAETMILGLRMTEGVSLEDFEARFHQRLQDRYADRIRHFRDAGLLEMEEGHLRLTGRGFDVSNLVMCEFL